jgi:hypothetical protein
VGEQVQAPQSTWPPQLVTTSPHLSRHVSAFASGRQQAPVDTWQMAFCAQQSPLHVAKSHVQLLPSPEQVACAGQPGSH